MAAASAAAAATTTTATTATPRPPPPPTTTTTTTTITTPTATTASARRAAPAVPAEAAARLEAAVVVVVGGVPAEGGGARAPVARPAGGAARVDHDRVEAWRDELRDADLAAAVCESWHAGAGGPPARQPSRTHSRVARCWSLTEAERAARRADVAAGGGAGPS